MDTLINESTVLAKNTRRRSGLVSAIPRPCSGTSRRCTPINLHSSSIFSPTIEFNTRRISQNTSSAKVDREPIPHPYPSKPLTSKSMPPFAQRQDQDLSGLKQQLQMRTFSLRSLSDPDAIESPPKGVSLAQKLPVSRTEKDNQKDWNIIPRRSLMQPLSPPLPKSQTIGNFSCFNSIESRESPMKAEIEANHSPSKSTVATINVFDALKESRMSGQEIEIMNQVQKEAINNQLRLRGVFSSPKGKSRASFPSETNITINLSVNDAIKVQYSEERGVRSTTQKPLSVTRTRQPEPNHTFSPSDDQPSFTSRTEVRGKDNLKMVYTAQDPAYWLGRYMSLNDQLRRVDLKMKDPSKPLNVDTTSHGKDLYDIAQVSRIQKALEELRSYCGTIEALNSFEKFQADLKRNLSRLPKLISRSVSDYAIVNYVEQRHPYYSSCTIREPDDLETPLASDCHGNDGRRFISTHTQGTGYRSNKSSQNKNTLSKSMTTGNLASLASSMLRKQSMPNTDGVNPRCYNNGSLALQTAVQKRANAIQNYQRHNSRQKPTVLRKMSNGHSEGNHNGGDEGKASFQKGDIPVESADITISSLENDTTCKASRFERESHLQSSNSLPAGGRRHTYVDNSSKAIVENDAQIMKRVRRMPERRSSGEVIKGLFGAGVREVRKMSRRVSGAMS